MRWDSSEPEAQVELFFIFRDAAVPRPRPHRLRSTRRKADAFSPVEHRRVIEDRHAAAREQESAPPAAPAARGSVPGAPPPQLPNLLC